MHMNFKDIIVAVRQTLLFLQISKSHKIEQFIFNPEKWWNHLLVIKSHENLEKTKQLIKTFYLW